MAPASDLVSFSATPRQIPRRAVRQFADTLRRRLAPAAAFHVLIADDRRLRRLNADFLGRNYAADVLAFPAGGGDTLGDIAISWQRAAEQAERMGHPLELELYTLMLHGLLHLLGMDHETDGGRMARREAAWRRRLGLPPARSRRGGATGVVRRPAAPRQEPPRS
ncbi:MAG: rRNA maturation RNase YbeY [Acidobacteria bacterium]|nr:rRNA maturation RNase YbeY [Acidobacteriota bacterium]